MATEKVITITSKAISATKKVILATEEVMTATTILKCIYTYFCHCMAE